MENLSPHIFFFLKQMKTYLNEKVYVVSNTIEKSCCDKI